MCSSQFQSHGRIPTTGITANAQNSSAGRGIPGRCRQPIAVANGETLKLPFLIRRAELGFLLGYVGVPDDSPLAGRDFDEVNGLLPQGVHGALTYSGGLQEAGQFDILKKHYFYGFDCAHAHDVAPALLNPVRPSFEDDPLLQRIQEITAALCESLGTSMEALKKEMAKHARYRDLAYVWEECMRLACQLGDSCKACRRCQGKADKPAPATQQLDKRSGKPQ